MINLDLYEQLLKNGQQIQIVCSLADLKELFNQWQDERDSMKSESEPKEDRLLSADEAAAILRVTSVTLWRWAKMGYLKPVKAGRKVHYWKSAIDNLLKNNSNEIPKDDDKESVTDSIFSRIL